MTKPDDKLLTPQEVGEILAEAYGRPDPSRGAIPEKTLRDWRNTNHGPRWIMVGSKPRYWRSAVDSWLRNGDLTEAEELPVVAAATRLCREEADQLKDAILLRDGRIIAYQKRIHSLEAEIKSLKLELYRERCAKQPSSP